MKDTIWNYGVGNVATMKCAVHLQLLQLNERKYIITRIIIPENPRQELKEMMTFGPASSQLLGCRNVALTQPWTT